MISFMVYDPLGFLRGRQKPISIFVLAAEDSGQGDVSDTTSAIRAQAVSD